MSFNSQDLIDVFNSVGIKTETIISDEISLVLSIVIRVKTGSKRERIEIGVDGDIIFSIPARPVDGEANKYLKKSLAKRFGISNKCVEIISGERSKIKKLYISFVEKVGKGSDYFVARVKNLSKD